MEERHNESEKSDLYLDENFEFSGDISIFDELEAERKLNAEKEIKEKLKESSDTNLILEDETSLSEHFTTKIYRGKTIDEISSYRYCNNEERRNESLEYYENLLGFDRSSEDETVQKFFKQLNDSYDRLNDIDDLLFEIINNTNEKLVETSKTINYEVGSINFELFEMILINLVKGKNAKLITELMKKNNL